MTRTVSPSLEIHEPPDGADPGVVAAPLIVALVLAGPQVVVAPPVVGLLVHQPVSVHHVAGVEVGHAETVHEVGAVVGQLHHLSAHVEMLVQPHLEAAAMLQRAEGSEVTTQHKSNVLSHTSQILNLKPNMIII